MFKPDYELLSADLAPATLTLPEGDECLQPIFQQQLREDEMRRQGRNAANPYCSKRKRRNRYAVTVIAP